MRAVWVVKRINPIRMLKGLIVSCFFLITSLFILTSINEFQMDIAVQRFGQCVFSHASYNVSPKESQLSEELWLSNSSSSDMIKILIGVLTVPDHYQRRNFLRLIYGTQSPVGAQIDVKFVFCNLSREDQNVFVALEIMRYDDIIILNCTENMNTGKTYTYFSSLPDILMPNDTNAPYDPPYDYVMKADDDTYFRLQSLVDSLVPLPRKDLYYGYIIPCTSMELFQPDNYMSGMGYLVSWDIVEWIKDSDIPPKNLKGPEDMMFGGWLRDGHRGENRYNMKWRMYNYPDPPSICTHELWPDTIAVHRLKDQEQWLRTLEYFNVTQNLKPSRFYHIHE